MYDNESPSEPKQKCFEFDITVFSKLKGYVWADNLEDAVEQIKNKKWDEIEDSNVLEVYSIDSVSLDEKTTNEE